MLGNSWTKQRSHRLADAVDAQTGQQSPQTAALAGLDGVEQVLRRQRTHALQTDQLIFFETIQIGYRRYQPAGDQLLGQFLADAFDVHAFALGERLDTALQLSGTGRRGRAARRRRIVLAHAPRAAYRTFRREFEDFLAALACFVQRLFDVGNDLAALDDDNAVADANVLLLDLGGVMQRGPRYRGAAQLHRRIEEGHRRQNAVLANINLDFTDIRNRLFGLELVRRRPARLLGGRAEPPLLIEVVHLDDHAVRLIRQIETLLRPAVAIGDHLLHRVEDVRFRDSPGSRTGGANRALPGAT